METVIKRTKAYGNELQSFEKRKDAYATLRGWIKGDKESEWVANRVRAKITGVTVSASTINRRDRKARHAQELEKYNAIMALRRF
jgi:hypothetical protein